MHVCSDRTMGYCIPPPPPLSKQLPEVHAFEKFKLSKQETPKIHCEWPVKPHLSSRVREDIKCEKFCLRNSVNQLSSSSIGDEFKCG